MDFRYRLDRLAPRTDGSGMIDHDIWAEYSLDGEEWTVVPSHHKTICVPTAGAKLVMDMPDATGPQRTAKNQAYKDLLVECRNVQPTPYPVTAASDWSPSGLATYMEAYTAAQAAVEAINDATEVEAQRVHEYITVTLGLSYPVPFRI